MTGFWGHEDISIHFCEDKYTHMFWIAEYYNTISCVFYILSGMMLWKLQREKTIGISLICVGLGSMVLHGTLRYYGQWMDEVAMLITSFFGIRKIKKNISNIFLIPIIAFYSYFQSFFLYFLIIFTGSQIFLGYKSIKTIKNKKVTLKKKIMSIMYIQFFLMGAICWLTDQFYCHELKDYHFHAWWHLFTSIAAFCGFSSF